MHISANECAVPSANKFATTLIKGKNTLFFILKATIIHIILALVAYLMSLDQSHELQEAKLTSAPASSPAPGSSPAPAKEEKK